MPLDPEYLRRYRRYVKAMRSYELLLKKRKETRAQWGNQQKQPETPRRPFGAPKDYRPSQAVGSTEGSTTGMSGKNSEFTFATKDGRFGTKLTPQDLSDVLSEFSASDVHNEINRQIYLRAKDYYLKCKKEFFDYAFRRGPRPPGLKPPRQRFEKNLNSAKRYLQDAVAPQAFGFNELAEKSIQNAQREVETACYKAWENYQNNPDDKGVVEELFDVAADAQYLPLANSPIVQKISNEISSILNSGKIK
jgi:hypothetical protein